MAGRVVLIHTIPFLIDVFKHLGDNLLPGVWITHILDEPLLEQVRQRGELAAEDSERLLSHVLIAADIGADAVLVTCSTVSPCVDDVRPQVKIPVKKIDEAMIAQAVKVGKRIGVVATAETTLEPTRRLLQEEASRLNKPIEVKMALVEGALPALMRGEGSLHDRLVTEATLELAKSMDVIILAQASMARVLAQISESECQAPVLSSPHLALEQLRPILAVEA
jgi:Asp/Glu/hydantoin racemase